MKETEKKQNWWEDLEAAAEAVVILGGEAMFKHSVHTFAASEVNHKASNRG